MSLNTTAATWVALSTPTAANLNLEVRDAVNGIQAAWTSWTPALTATSVNPTLGTGGTVTGTYARIGKTVYGTLEILFGSSGVNAGTGSYGISLPVATTTAAVNGGRVDADGIFYDSNTGNYYVLQGATSSSTVIRCAVNAGGLLGSTVPVVPAANDAIRLKFLYEAA